MKMTKVRCLNCNRVEEVNYSILMSGQWVCYCSSKIWEIVREENSK